MIRIIKSCECVALMTCLNLLGGATFAGATALTTGLIAPALPAAGAAGHAGKPSLHLLAHGGTFRLIQLTVAILVKLRAQRLHLRAHLFAIHLTTRSLAGFLTAARTTRTSSTGSRESRHPGGGSRSLAESGSAPGS